MLLWKHTVWAISFLCFCAEQLLLMPSTPGFRMLSLLEGLTKQTYMKSLSLGLSRMWAGNYSSVYIHHIEPARYKILLCLSTSTSNILPPLALKKLSSERQAPAQVGWQKMKESLKIYNTIVIFSVSPIVQRGVHMCFRKKSIHLVLTLVRKKIGFSHFRNTFC